MFRNQTFGTINLDPFEISKLCQAAAGVQNADISKLKNWKREIRVPEACRTLGFSLQSVVVPDKNNFQKCEVTLLSSDISKLKSIISAPYDCTNPDPVDEQARAAMTGWSDPNSHVS